MSIPNQALPSPEVLHSINQEVVYDKNGDRHRLGELMARKRTLLVFIRHFWCMNCQAYVRRIGEIIPPSSLPSDAQILIIGCGSYHPIESYISKTSSPYPIYTNPDLSLYKLLEFKSSLAGENKDEGARDYMQDQGSYVSRVMGGLKGALGDLGNLNNVGPKSQNGGEVIISPDGKCEYIYRMQNTVDHTDISKIATLLGVKPASTVQAPDRSLQAEGVRGV